MRRGPARLAMAIGAALLALASVPAAAGPPAPAGVRDSVTETLSRRLFPLLDALGRNPVPLLAKPGVSAALQARKARAAACAQDLACLAKATLWTDAEAATLADAAAALPGLPTADDGAAAQARREIAGLNTIVRTYALGAVPRYPKIDGSGPIAPEEQTARIQAAAWLAQTPRAGSAQALDPGIEFALALLDASDRTDAIGFEPLTGGLNAAAFARAKRLDWNRFRYSAMIVTGVGPEVEGMPLSPFGKYHLRLAADHFAQGDIPFIIVTGGRAHPRETRFTEAEQMRAALIERYSVPADAIVIEPYARHTTTNLRNAARLLMAMKAPLGKDTLIVCNPGQSGWISSPSFVQRNQAELGYQPGTVGHRLSPTELEFRPSAQSARIDPLDPLDP